ncbi:MAG: sigma-54-dependent Fis family transcriptional regulator [Planctomycetaceae bacterium]
MPSDTLEWSHTRWVTDRPIAGVARLLERVAQRAVGAAEPQEFLKQSLPELLVEFGGEYVAIVRKTPGWQIDIEAGREESFRQRLPTRMLEGVLDRSVGGRTLEGPDRWLAVPMGIGESAVLVLAGERLDSERLGDALAVGRALGLMVSSVRRMVEQSERALRLRKTLELAKAFAGERETLPLLELMAQQATELLNCDRASIFIWDRDAKQVIACPALGMEGGRLWLPDNKGIVGEVIQTGRAIRVDEAYADPRFDQSVDRQTGYHTRTLLCVPMREAGGRCIGAFELINRHGGTFDDEDQSALEDLCIPAAIAVQHTRELDQLVRSNRQLTEQVAGQSRIIGESPAMIALRGTIDRLAATDLPVLILGESGTGKEVAAQSLHYQGPRADHPFIAVNCAALTETLLESELFGHEKGAFTDAHIARAGKFELADGGTLFLDEIGDMSPGGQAKLLRVLEQKVITRVGGTQAIPTNVRVIAATNSNLAEAVRDKRFRQDLYYRLSVVTVDLPPLRDRPEDVLPLARHFLELFSRQAKRPGLELSVDARRRLQAHAWPGNIRELRNLMERVAFLVSGPRVEVDDLAFILAPEKDSYDELGEGVGLTEATNRFQQDYITRAIRRVQGNMSEAARLLGLHRSNLYRKMRQLDMEVDEAKP